MLKRTLISFSLIAVLIFAFGAFAAADQSAEEANNECPVPQEVKEELRDEKAALRAELRESGAEREEIRSEMTELCSQVRSEYGAAGECKQDMQLKRENEQNQQMKGSAKGEREMKMENKKQLQENWSQ